MPEIPRYDVLTLCPDFRFIRVESENGVFYDLVRKWRARDHVFHMKKKYIDAQTVSRASVPPCIFRDFTELDGADCFHESIWKDGTQLLFPSHAQK